MTLRIKQPTLIRNLVDGVSVTVTESASPAIAVNDQAVTMRRARMNLNNLLITVLAAEDRGGVKLIDLPFRNMMIMGAEVNCTVVKGNNTNGIVAATQINMSIGTVLISALPTGLTQNIISLKNITTVALSVPFQGHSNDHSTTFPIRITDNASAALYMNMTSTITADDSVSVTGTFDLYYMDLGKED